MKVSTYLGISGAIAFFFGLAFLVAPEFSSKQYGIPPDPHVLMLGRYFGATLLSPGIIFWCARATRDDLVVRALLRGATAANLAGLVVSVWAGLAGLQNAMAWFSVAVYGLLLLGAVYFLSSAGRRA